MTDKTLNIQKVLIEMGAEARKYFFPGYEFEEEAHVCSAMTPLADMCDFDIDFDIAPQETKIRPRSISPRKEPPVGMFSFMTTAPKEESEEDVAHKFSNMEILFRCNGVSLEDLEAYISYKVPEHLSKLHITSSHSIILENYDHKEVKMDTLTKAVFLLFLKHPEGIRYKELSDYATELEEIYTSITGRTDTQAIHESIKSLTDPLSNSINEKVSRVKRAFINAVHERVAKKYYIDGQQGEAKKILLDRSLVIWE